MFVEDEKTRENKSISLRQSWLESRCTKGSYIHLIGEFDITGHCVVDDAQNMIVLHPDHLISATVVADSFQCTRRAVLQDRVKATGEASRPMVYGTLLHEVFQEAIKKNRWELEWLKETVDQLLTTHIEDLYEIHVEFAEAADYLMSKMPEMMAWAEVFLAASPKVRIRSLLDDLELTDALAHSLKD